MNMLHNNENTNELIVRLRSWVDNPHLRSLGYGCYGTKASSDIEQAISEINNLRLANAGFTLGSPAITEPEYHSFPWNGPLPNEKIVGDTVFIPTDSSLDKVDSKG